MRRDTHGNVIPPKDSIPEGPFYAYVWEILYGAGGFTDYEHYESVGHEVSREYSIACWVLRCLGNGRDIESSIVLDLIAERRKLSRS